MGTLNGVLSELAAEIPGIIAVGVAGLDGLGLAHVVKNSEVDLEIADAQLALVLKLVYKTVDQLTVDKIEDNLITTRNLYILTLFLGDGSHFLAIIADKKSASLGNIRLMAHQFADVIDSVIPRRRGRTNFRETGGK